MKNSTSKNIFKRFGGWLKERVRRFFVMLKKNPQLVPIVALCASFLQYSLNLTHISNTTAKLQGPNMGLAEFATMLFMILSFVCMLNAFPKRKKPVIPMMILMVILYGIIIFADIHYLGCIDTALLDPSANYTNEALYYIITAYNTIIVHIVLTAVTILLVVLEPVIAKLVKKINTSIEIEETNEIAKIDIAEEE